MRLKLNVDNNRRSFEGLRELALFAGAGGGILGGHLLGWRTVCAVEYNRYAASVLAARQNDGTLRPFPIWNDVQTFDGKPWRGRVDVVSGGFPCQDISAAGKGKGIEGERSGLWKEFARIIYEVGPRHVFVENSPILTVRGIHVVLGDLAAMGYDAAWGVLGANSVGAPHKRERIWIVGQLSDAGRVRFNPRGAEQPLQRAREDGTIQHMADAESSQSGFEAERKRGTGAVRRNSNSRRIAGKGGIETDVADAGHLRGRDGAEPDETEFAALTGRSEVADSVSIRRYSDRLRWEPEEEITALRNYDSPLADTYSERFESEEGYRKLEGQRLSSPSDKRRGRSWEFPAPSWWEAEPDVGRVVDGLAYRVDRLRAIGNGQVPAVAARAFEYLYTQLNLVINQ